MSLNDVHDKPGYLIRQCQQIAVALFQDQCREFDLTPMQYAILRAVEAEPGLDQISLAGLVALDRSNAARLCATLEKRNLLRRAPDPKDRRGLRLLPTDRGRALLDRAEPAVREVQRMLLSPLTSVERTVFMAALRKIAVAHNEISRAPLRKNETDRAA